MKSLDWVQLLRLTAGRAETNLSSFLEPKPMSNAARIAKRSKAHD
jgi:hypothetical protein